MDNDITERKRAEEALRESEKKYRLLIDNANESIIVAQDGLLKFVNPMTLALLGGYSEQELIDRPFPEFIHPDDRSMVVENYRRRIANEAVLPRYAFRVVTREGIVKWVEINATLIEWQGKPATLNFLTDITERMRAEKEVQALKTQMDFILGATKTGLDIIDAKFNIHYIDPEWKKVHGDYAGLKCYQYFMDRNTPCPDCRVVKALQTKSTVVTEEVLLKENSRPIQITTIPFQNDAGEWLVAEVNVDITNRKRNEVALKEYSEHLEEMIEERTKQLQTAARLAALGETATMIGHDLRNPLQVIISMVYLAKEMLTSADISPLEGRLSVTEILDDIEKSNVYMNKIVSDLQSYAGPLNLEFVETDIYKLISDALSILEIPKSVEVSIEVENGFSEINIDPEKIKRVIVNLVNNSIQSMPKGGQITITAIRKGESVVLTIKDEGVGITNDNIPKLFLPLFTTKAKGTGLGLAICKLLVEAHRGNIVVTSKVNAGTEVTIEIPQDEKT